MELPKPVEIVKDMVNLARCVGELTVMYAQEKIRDFEAMMDDAEDCWGDGE